MPNSNRNRHYTHRRAGHQPQQSFQDFGTNNLFEVEGKTCRYVPLLAREIGEDESILLLQLEFFIATQGVPVDGRPTFQASLRSIGRFLSWDKNRVHRAARSLQQKRLIAFQVINGTTSFYFTAAGFGDLSSIRLKMHETEALAAAISLLSQPQGEGISTGGEDEESSANECSHPSREGTRPSAPEPSLSQSETELSQHGTVLSLGETDVSQGETEVSQGETLAYNECAHVKKQEGKQINEDARESKREGATRTRSIDEQQSNPQPKFNNQPSEAELSSDGGADNEPLIRTICQLWGLPPDHLRNERDTFELSRIASWLLDIEATHADIATWRSRWDRPSPPYLSQLNASEWTRLMPDWVSRAAVREAEHRRRERQAQEEQKSIQERQAEEAQAREDAELDARYEAFTTEAKEQLNASVKRLGGAVVSVFGRTIPDSVMAFHRRQLLREGWKYQPDDGRGKDFDGSEETGERPAPICRRSGGVELSEKHGEEPAVLGSRTEATTNTTTEFLARMKAKALAEGAPEDILATFDQDPAEREELLKSARRAA